MFTGFASENTPAIQVWDFFRTFANTSAIRSVSLADDCAPIQVFRTGATGSSAVRIYLPTAPIEGKQITIVNQGYGLNAQKIEIYSSDKSADGSSNALFTMGVSDSIILVYSKQNITFGTNVGVAATGWISLNKGSPTSANYYSAMSGGENNVASGSYSFIGSGSGNTASGPFSAIIGGSANTTSGAYSAIVGGQALSSNATQSVVIGGISSISDGTNSVVVGGSQGSTRSISGNFVVPASSSPIQNSNGKTQSATLLLGRQTTDATATVLASNTSSASTTNQVILPNNSAYTFQGTCIANVTGGGTTSGWKFEGVIKRGVGVGTTALVAAVTPTVIAQDVGAVTWVLAITADTTNGGIAVTVTGAAATTIRWVCKIETTEVAF
jgi:hypothetical protein